MTKITPVKRKKSIVVKNTLPEFKPYFSYEDGGDISDAIDLSKEIDLDTSEIYYHHKSNENYEFQWDIEDFPFCCAIKELGSFNVNMWFPKNILKDILDAFVSHSKFTLVINTNGKDDCIPLEAALKECKNWTLVKTLESPNTNNTVKMWVSNN